MMAYCSYTYILLTGRLPNHAQVLGYLLHCQKNDSKKNLPIHNVAKDLVLHWVYCTIYTIRLHHVEYQLEMLVKEYNRLKNYPKKKRGQKFFKDHSDFRTKLGSVMDIKVTDISRQKCLEDIWGVKMSFHHYKFYENQKQTPPIGYCTSFNERKLAICQEKTQVYCYMCC